MNAFVSGIQLLIGFALLILALAATKRIGKLAFLTALLPQSRSAQIAQFVLFLMAGLATFAGLNVPFLVFFASCLALVSVAFPTLQSLRAKGVVLWPVPLVIALGSIALTMAQPLGLKVLALPKADDLKVEPIPARVVKTYDEGLWFEGIAADKEGNLYLSGNRGLDFSRADYYKAAQGELVVRRRDGNEQVIFKTPTGYTAGVPAVADDGSIFLTSHSDSSVIWKITATGKSALLARLPQGSWPNGIDFGPDGMLYSPDSNLGTIWRINPQNGDVARVIEDKALLARPYISLAPGANGLHFKGRDMYVTVSDRTTVLKFTLKETGQFDSPIVVATGIPGDDFAIGKDGALFVTTHPYNTLVRVAPNGTKTIVANQEQHVVGATDAVFGKGPDDQETLYVVTDGGAFTGGPKARGELIALQPYSQK